MQSSDFTTSILQDRLNRFPGFSLTDMSQPAGSTYSIRMYVCPRLSIQLEFAALGSNVLCNTYSLLPGDWAG